MALGDFRVTGATISADSILVGATSGTTTLQASATASGTLTLPAATDTIVGKATTDTFTNKTFDTAGTGNSFAINGTGITSVTGTGAVVLGTSPTLTTPDLGTPSALTLTNATGLSLTSGVTGTLPLANGGTGTTDGSITGTGALTFTGALDNNITVTTSGTGNVVLNPSGTGVIDASSVRITNVADPTGAQDAATKAYVDTVAQGLHVHEAARVATTDTLATISGDTVTYDNGTAGVGATLTLSTGITTLDGVTLATNDRILVKDEATTANNGMYVYTSSTVLTRATDFDSGAEIAGGDFTFVEEGTSYGKTSWVQTIEVTTVGTDTVEFQQFAGAGSFTADEVSLTLSGTEFSIKSTYVGQTSITTLGTVGTGTWQGSTVDVAYGGTGQTSYTDGQLLIGNSTGNTLAKATLTAGSGVSVTNGSGSITLGLDINGLTAVDPIVDADEFAVYDADAAGNKKVTAENLADYIYAGVSGDVTITEAGVATVAIDSIALGTDTTGNYVQDVTGGTGIDVTGGSGEGSSPTVAIDSTVATLTGSQVFTNKTFDDPVLFSQSSANVGAIDVTELNSNTATSATTIASISASNFRTVKGVVSVTDTVNNEYQATEVIVTHDGTNCYYTEYAVVYSGASALATFSAIINAGNIELQTTQTSADSCDYHVMVQAVFV